MTNASLRSILLDPGPDAMEEFLRGWHGPPSAEPARPADAMMPAPLRRLYELAGAWPDAFEFNHLVVPPRLENGKLLFCVENQGVCLWATEPADLADAPVWSALMPDEHGTWMIEEAALSGFLLQMLVLEGVLAAEHSASAANLPREQLPAVLDPVEELPYGAWRWPEYPSRFYAGERLLVAAVPNPGPEYLTVNVAALDDEALTYLEPLVDESWERYSPQDAE